MAKNNKDGSYFFFECQIKGRQEELFVPEQVEVVAVEMNQSYDEQFKPLKYNNDALVGVSTLKLMEEKSSYSKEWFDTIHQFWQNLDPHFHLFFKANDHILSIYKDHKEPTNSIEVKKLDHSIHDIIDESITSTGVDLRSLFYLIDSIENFENKTQSPLLYNFKTKFAPDTREKLLSLHSLLYNLRSLAAADYNSFVTDASVEALKVDTITDYIQKAEYVANDAAIFFKFEKFSHQFRTNPAFAEFQKKFYQPMHQTFQNYCHNSYWLVHHLPPQFIDKLPEHQIEDFLYMLQMDWILGSDSGLLFKIREELFALKEGYKKIFWPECSGQFHAPTHRLTVSCQLPMNQTFSTKKKSA